ncbi:glycosyltransferase [Acidisoma silvae]|uniref:Glycosyltransferase family 4 protein n=1 Tax=Acidisoma silvae TaxID=2802396 RepID=A0A964DX21_9PROT|nr:glycosyltransferase [Acidisoma silvae]MCB8873629.1 glycosyltransferase family 4 protein [Acidisoma silvae]
MRVLVITPTPTHPATQGNRVRVAQVAGAMKDAGATVDLLYYAIDGSDQESINAMRAAWDTLYLVPTGGFRPRRAHPAYWGVDDWVSPNLLQAVRFLAETTHYDAVIVNYVWCSLLLDCFTDPRTLRILDTHDAFGGRHEVARQAGMQPHWFYTSLEEEGRGLDRANLVLAIQSDEARHFAAITATPVVTIEYAAPPHYLPATQADSLTIGYLGSGNPWNVRSVEEFDAALALSLAETPRVAWPKLYLFGGITRSVKDLKVFQPLGMVDDVADAYGVLDIVVNPMVGGTGLKIKTVEALAFGKPVLSTKAGGAGLEAIHTDLLHDDLAGMIDRLHHLIDHPEEVAPLAASMRAGYQAFYDSVHERLGDLAKRVGHDR